MAITRTTFAPQIDYDGVSNFVFSTYGMYMVSIPDESMNLRWDSASIPNRDGADAYGGELEPLQLNVRFEMDSYDPDTVHTRLELLRTALKGKTSATAAWPEGHFRFYLHNSSPNILYLDKCICQSMRVGNAANKYLKNGSPYTILEITLMANDPAWKTSAEVTTVEFEAPLIINVPTGETSALVINLSSTSTIKAKIDSSGNLKLTGELYEQQETIT